MATNTAGSLRRIYRGRDLLALLVEKEVKVKYKGTALGFLWSLVNPLLLMLVYSLVFSMISRGGGLPRYPLYLLAGLLPWNAITIAITTASQSIVANGALIRRVSFPREFLPLAQVLAAMVNLVLSMLVLPIFIIAFHQPEGPQLLALPLLLLLQLIFCAGLCLLLSASLVYFRDLDNLINLGITVTFFVTPILYSLQSFKHYTLARYLELNPLTWLMSGYQSVIWGDSWPDFTQLTAFAVFALALLAIGWSVFKHLEGRFAEEV